MYRPNRLKARIRAGEKSFGTWLQSGAATFAEIAGIAGFDFFILDQEHGIGDLNAAVDSMRAAACTHATGMVRVPSSHPTYVKRLVDAGIEGILVPMVETAAQAKEVVDACRYPPLGNRGNAADIARCSSYGLVPDYLARADDNLLIAVQIETATAVRNAREIAAVDGVDLVFIGPTDLSGSIGLMGQTGHPKVEALIAETVAAAREVGKPLGTVPRQGRSWQQLFDEGFVFVATGSEIYSYRMAMLELMGAWRTYSGATPAPATGAPGSYGTRQPLTS